MKPFNLEKALAGEPILTRDRQKGYVKFCVEENNKITRLVGIVHNGSIIEIEKWFSKGNVLLDDISSNDILGMWGEPSPRVQLDLPCPLKDPNEGMYILFEDAIMQSSYSVNCKNNWLNIHSNITLLENGRCFATKEDAQEWLDAMRNARR